jgi:hypothetical protein
MKDRATVSKTEIRKHINKDFLRKFFMFYPIIISGERRNIMIDGLSTVQVAPHTCDIHDMEMRSTLHSSDFADVLAVNEDNPLESVTAERFDYLLDCALRSSQKLILAQHSKFEPKEYTSRYSTHDIINCIRAFREACGQESHVGVMILPPGKSVTNIMQRTAFVYHTEGMDKILRDPEKKIVIESSGLSTNRQQFIRQIGTRWISRENNLKLHHIIIDDLYRGAKYKKSVERLYNYLEIPLLHVEQVPPG